MHGGKLDILIIHHPFIPLLEIQGWLFHKIQASSDIGIEILNMGGNAIDAAVAVGFSLAITLPRAGNIRRWWLYACLFK